MSPGEAAAVLPVYVSKVTDEVRQQIAQRTPRAANALRNSAINVLNNPSPSAPGNPPGVRSHSLQQNWLPRPTASSAVIESQVDYAGYLEHGTSKMAARPFVDKIQEHALPKVISIFQEIGG